MHYAIRVIIFLIFIEYTLSQNNARLKDVLRNSSKFNNRNKTENADGKQHQTDNIFRSEILKNYKQCSSHLSDDNDDNDSENNRRRQKVRNTQFKRNGQLDNNYDYRNTDRNNNYMNSNNDNHRNGFSDSFQENHENAYNDRKNCENSSNEGNQYQSTYNNKANYRNGYYPNRNRFAYDDMNDNNRNLNRNRNCQQGNVGYNYEQVSNFENSRSHLQNQENDFRQRDYKYYNDNNYDTNYHRGYTGRKKRENKRDFENQCISQCIFGYMELLDDDQVPSETMVIKWVQDHVTNDDLKRIQIMREIRKCFARLSASDIDNGCEFSKELTKCLNIDVN